MNKSYALRVTCRSTRGIIAAISGYLAQQGCNIIDSSQFDDLETGRFFLRTSFLSEEGRSLSELSEGFLPVASQIEMDREFFDEGQKRKVMIMVSRFGHCLNDLLYRQRIGALPIEITGVVFNHSIIRGS